MVDRIREYFGLEEEEGSDSIMALEERKEKLTEIARLDLSRRGVVGRIITAIDTLNKMDGMYSEKTGINYNQIKIVFVEKGALPVEVISGREEPKMIEVGEAKNEENGL